MATVTVLGGGQLGRMLGLAGIPLGLSFRFLDPSDGAPARAVGDVVVGALDDIASATRAAEGARVVTYEWEGVPASTRRPLEHLCPVLPPAPGWNEELQARAEGCLAPLFESLDYVGVGCVELFDTGGELLANEMAPRVHNSGHWTIEGAETSQFENHLRAVVGWPLGSTRV